MIQAALDGPSAIERARSTLALCDVSTPLRLQRLIHDRADWAITLSDPQGRRYEARVGENGVVTSLMRNDRYRPAFASPRLVADRQARDRARRWLRRLRARGPWSEPPVRVGPDGTLSLDFPLLAHGRPFVYSDHSYGFTLDGQTGELLAYQHADPIGPVSSERPKIDGQAALEVFRRAFAAAAVAETRSNGDHVTFEVVDSPRLGYFDEWQAPATLVWKVSFRLEGSSRFGRFDFVWSTCIDAITGELRTRVGPFDLRGVP